VDFGAILLADEPRTYELIEHMFTTLSECFTTRKIHVGMDEAHMLGRGKHLDKFRRTLEIVKILNSRNIRLFSFYTPKRKNPDNYKNEVIDRLGQFCEEAKKYDIVLCHENEKGIYGDKAERCLEIHKALPDIKGVFDPANFVQCGVDTLKAWEMLKNKVEYLHIKDAVGQAIVPAGEGEGNIKEILTGYFELGGEVISMEPHLSNFVGLNNLEREGEKTKIAYSYASTDEAFDAAFTAINKVLSEV
jgi:sugar phosphate isomerase/epimerase